MPREQHERDEYELGLHRDVRFAYLHIAAIPMVRNTLSRRSAPAPGKCSASLRAR